MLGLEAKLLGGGKIKLRWSRLDKSVMNFVEISDGMNMANWRPIGKTAKSSFVASGLNPGQLYSFRVYGSNNLGDGNTSDPAEQRAL